MQTDLFPDNRPEIPVKSNTECLQAWRERMKLRPGQAAVKIGLTTQRYRALENGGNFSQWPEVIRRCDYFERVVVPQRNALNEGVEP